MILRLSILLMTNATHAIPEQQTNEADVEKLADFVLFTQRSCILNLSSKLSKEKLSFPQFFLLAYLSSEEFLAMSDIAHKMGHSTAAATGLVDRLERLNFVERRQASEDRRKIMVRITDIGINMVETMRKEIALSISSIMTEADSEEAETVENAKQVIDRRL